MVDFSRADALTVTVTCRVEAFSVAFDSTRGRCYRLLTLVVVEALMWLFRRRIAGLVVHVRLECTAGERRVTAVSLVGVAGAIPPDCATEARTVLIAPPVDVRFDSAQGGVN